MDIKELKGKTIEKITVTDDEILFDCEYGQKYKMYHEQECCECVYIDEIIGDIIDLIGTPIVMAEEVCEGDYTDDGSCTWTFYKLATSNGYVTIRWYGESNGYYSEYADFKEII